MQRKPALALCFVALTAACATNSGAVDVADATRPDAMVDATVSEASVADASPSPDVAAMADARAVTDAAAADGSVVTGPGVAMFVAQGHMGRVTISCDEGRTWVANRSMDDSARCFTGGLDCDHNAVAGRGLAYGNGYFVATFGWGQPGAIRRSRNGVDWETTLSGHTFADVAFGNGVFLANERTPQRSSDGAAWAMAGNTVVRPWNVRTIGYVPFGARGRFLVSAESGTDRDINWSEDNGATWHLASTRPAECGQGAQGFAFGNGVTILTSGAGHVCRSIDGGDTWTRVALAGDLSVPVWTGDEFFVWAGNQRHRSVDGAQWTTAPLVPSSVNIGAVARGASGTFVAVRGGWQTWYDQQRFYRSNDGLNWEVLPTGSYVGSHPIYWIEFGYAPPGAVCPTR